MKLFKYNKKYLMSLTEKELQSLQYLVDLGICDLDIENEFLPKKSRSDRKTWQKFSWAVEPKIVKKIIYCAQYKKIFTQSAK